MLDVRGFQVSGIYNLVGNAAQGHLFGRIPNLRASLAASISPSKSLDGHGISYNGALSLEVASCTAYDHELLCAAAGQGSCLGPAT